jgi:coproporphyrinogen III oxidase-like Fe-S oxidoreductase
LPDDNEKTLMYQTIVDMLEKFSLRRYEVGSFGKKEIRSSHNSSYWDGSQYVGIGPGAHSRFFLKDQVAREARVQCLDPKLWQEMVAKTGHATQVRRKQKSLEMLTELIMTSLRTTNGIQQSRYLLLKSQAQVRVV